MFCPNCGKNCGNDRFCSDCGTRLHQNTESPKQSAQIPAGQPDPKESVSPVMPIKSSYIGQRRTYLDLNESSLTVSPTGGYDCRTIIPYDQLAAVVYLRPVSVGWGTSTGVMLLRGEAQKDLPIPAVSEMAFDGIAVIVPPEKAILFYHVYYALKAIAPPSAVFQLITPEAKVRNLDKLMQGIDLGYFWERYEPDRESAVRALREKHRVNNTAACVMIDREFDARQNCLYDEDPSQAVRDLNDIVTRKDKQARDINRLKSELRDIQAQRALEELSSSVSHIELMKMLDDK